MPEVVRVEKRDGVAHIVLNSPPANAMSPELMQGLEKAVEQVEKDVTVRAVIVRSEVGKIFMAGADLKYLLGLDEDGFRRYIRTAQETVNRLERLPKPTIAVMNGHTLGGGLEVALSCDFRYMAEAKALAGLPEVTLGLLPGAGGTQRLPRLIGRSKATELLIRGKPVQGPEALAMGLVDKVFPAEELLPAAEQFAEELAKMATQAIARIKDCLRMPGEDKLAAGLNRELEGISYLFMHTQDCKEGIQAFNEKRPPKYVGK